MSRILVVEDNHDLAFGLRNNLEIEGYQVEVATDGRAGLQQARAANLDLVILDLMLPELDGFRVLRALRQEGRDVPVLILTARGEEEHRLAGFERGADDYLIKPFSLKELNARLEAVLRRAGPQATVIRIGDAEVDLGAHEIRRGGNRHRLLAKEVDLLRYLIRHAGRVVDRAEILREVWGYETYPTTRTVDTHVFKLRQKLEETADQPRHLVTVHGVGYKLLL